MGSWTFRLNDLQVELLPINNAGVSFARAKRSATVREVFGATLPVVLPEHAGTKVPAIRTEEDQP